MVLIVYSQKLNQIYCLMKIEFVQHVWQPIVFCGGAGEPSHFRDLFLNTECNSVGAASIFSFTQFTPLDIKQTLRSIGKSVRID